MSVKESDDLPSDFPTLRECQNFYKYGKLRYEDIGRRLAPLLEVEDITADSLDGNFTLLQDQGKVRCNVLLDPQGVPLLVDFNYDEAEDWFIKKNFTKSATLVSEEIDSTTGLHIRFLKTHGRELPDETSDWNIAANRLPLSITSGPSHSDGGRGSDSGGHAPPPPPGRGRGKAQAKMGGRGRGGTASAASA